MAVSTNQRRVAGRPSKDEKGDEKVAGTFSFLAAISKSPFAKGLNGAGTLLRLIAPQREKIPQTVSVKLAAHPATVEWLEPLFDNSNQLLALSCQLLASEKSAPASGVTRDDARALWPRPRVSGKTQNPPTFARRPAAPTRQSRRRPTNRSRRINEFCDCLLGPLQRAQNSR